MSYLQVHFWPGGTEEQYGAMIKVLHPATGLPEGQRSHTSGPTEGGYLISVVWDSKEQSEAFMRNTLQPALPVEGGFVGGPEERVAEVAAPRSTLTDVARVRLFHRSDAGNGVALFDQRRADQLIPPRHCVECRLG